MPTRCPSCGTYNSLGAINCTKCQNSLEHISLEAHKSLKDLRAFGIIFLITSIISVAEFGLNLAGTTFFGTGLGLRLTSILSGLTTSLSSSNLTVFLLIIEVVSVVFLFVECISFIYLRSSFTKLRKFDFNFSTPATGTNLLIVGIIMALVGIGVVLAFLFPLIGSLGLTTAIPTALPLATLGLIALGGLVGTIGALLVLIGYIIGVLLGLHRLSSKFEESYFDYALVLIIVSLFFTPLGLIAAALVIWGTRRSGQRLKDADLEAMMASP